MLRKLFSLLPAAFESLIVAVVGLGPVLLATGLLWAVHDRFAVGTASLWWQTGVHFWLLALGDPLPIAAAKTAAGAQLPAYSISLIPLGLTALILWRAWSGGRRFGADPELWPAWLGFLLGSGVCGAIAAATASGRIWSGVLAAVLLPGLAFVLGTLRESQSRESHLLRSGCSRVGLGAGTPGARLTRGLLRSVALTTLIWVCGAAALVAMAVFTRWMNLVALSEQLHVDWLGAVILAAVQLAYVPDLILWAMHWALGAGFAIGVGSSVTPFQTRLAPLPSWPVLAALPSGASPFFWAALLIPFLAFVCGGILLWRVRRTLPPLVTGWMSWLELPLLALGQAVGVAVLIWLGAVASQGAIGPGRLSGVGPHPALSWWICLGAGWVLTLAVLLVQTKRWRLPAEGTPLAPSEGPEEPATHTD